MRFQIYRDKKGEYRWRLRAGNCRIVATSGEGYRRKRSLLKTLHAILFCFRSYQPLIEDLT